MAASARHDGGVSRREFLGGTVAATTLACMPGAAADGPDNTGKPAGYFHHGRTAGYPEFKIIDAGRRIQRIESFHQDPFTLVRVTTDDGREGVGQIASHDTAATLDVLHRRIAPHVLGRDAADIDALVDRCIDANHKFPWSFVCRALGGVDTALWDLYGRIREKPVAELLGGTVRPLPAYGSSMSRSISPADEAARLARLRDEHGFQAFKIRVGQECGHDADASPGRTEAIIPAVRKAVGDTVALKADANSGFTPPRAIEVGRLLEANGYGHYEEPCPYWELEWTAEVASALDIPVAGGEQDNDLAQWRRMIHMNAVDIAQPDVLYVGGITRAWRVGRMAHAARKTVVPHSANHSMVTLFTLHLCAALPNFGPFVEWSIEDGPLNARNADMFSPRPVIRDGRACWEAGPGWGVRVSPDWLKSATYQRSERP